MRLALLFLIAGSAAAQPALPVDAPAPPRWRVDASAAVSGSGANDPGVRVERRLVGPVWAGLGRTEVGAATVYLAAERSAGPLVPRATVGLRTVAGVDGGIGPVVGVGLDAYPIPAVGVGVGLAIDQTLALGVPSDRVVRMGLRVRPDRALPALTRTAFRLDVGLAYTSGDEPYAEVSGAATRSLVGPVVLSVGAARAGALFDVSYGDPDLGSDLDPGFGGVPSYVQSWTTVSVLGGVRLDGAGASFQATVGPVLSVAEKTFDEVLVGAGVGAEVGVLDLYPVPSVGLGLSVHGATTTSHSWAGGRLGIRVRL